jgi:uncharacterized protein YndB with AHSA1/START domain
MITTGQNEKKKLLVTATSDREITMTRVFNAPRSMVFEAMTKPELIKRWLGVFGGWKWVVCEVDLKVGGAYRYVWQGPSGEKLAMGGIYREIVRPERIVCTERFDQHWYPGDALDTTVLEEKNGKTTVTTTIRYESKEARDSVLKSPMEGGVSKGYDKLEELLAARLTGQDK